MSGRYYDYDKGSSRSARDDSRTHKDRDRQWDSRGRAREAVSHRRSRSRSPRQISPSASSSSSSKRRSGRSGSRDRDYEDKRSTQSPHFDHAESDEEVPAPPPPPRISKITMGFTKPKAPIKMNLGGPSKVVSAHKPTIASVFNADEDDDEPEEMPAEAKMRMRNIGRETPTSAGPNSFGKTKQGFCDAKKVFEKNLKQALDTAEKPAIPKFPQTIYRIKGP